MNSRPYRHLLGLAAVAASLVSAAPAAAAARTDFAAPGLAFNVLTPGEQGGIIPTVNSTDQAKMYDALTPLRGNVSLAQVQSGLYYKSEVFDPTPAGTITHPPGQASINIVRDAKFVPHVTVQTRAQGAIAMGYLAAYDRKLLLDYGRGAAYVAALDVPGISAFGLITSATKFTPSQQAKDFVNAQITAFKNGGADNMAVYNDFQNFVIGVNLRYNQLSPGTGTWTAADAMAAFAFIGSIFGNGGGNEVANSEFLANLQSANGQAKGLAMFRDFRHSNDPDSPVSWKDSTFPYNNQPTNTTNAAVPGSKVVDPGTRHNWSSTDSSTSTGSAANVKRYMSNALLVPASRSTNSHPLAVMGPQLGYYYPEIVMEVDIHGGGYNFRGAVAPVAPYGLIGRGADYAWSLTSAGSDNTDQFVEELCNPTGGAVTRATKYYKYKSQCKAMTAVSAGNLGSANTPVNFYETVHGPVSGTVLIGGKPYAISKQRATRGREPYSALALADLTMGKVTSPTTFFQTANKFETTFNWHYVDNNNICFFSSGRLPVRASGTDSALPTLGTGAYDWTGYITQNQHPHGCNPVATSGDKASDLIVNWNNHPAKGWGAADDEWSYTSTHRMDLFQRLFRTTRSAGKTLNLNDVVGVMNQAATEDAAAVDAWPNVKRVLLSGATGDNDAAKFDSAAPDATTATLAKTIDTWYTVDDAARKDDNADGHFDTKGPYIWDVAWPKLADAVVGGRLSAGLKDQLWGVAGGRGDKTYQGMGVGFTKKDLGRLLGDTFQGNYSQTYCGGAEGLNGCKSALWTALAAAKTQIVTDTGVSAPGASDWKYISGHDAKDQRQHFGPLYPVDVITHKEATMRWVNRPTFQQAISFDGHR